MSKISVAWMTVNGCILRTNCLFKFLLKFVINS